MQECQTFLRKVDEVKEQVMNNQTKYHIALWDNLKFILILLVVVGHMADTFTGESESFRALYLFIYSFHMPLFFFVSGLFFSEKRILSKILFYLSFTYLLKIILVIIERCFGETQPYFVLLAPDGPSWFTFVLAAFTLISYLIRNHKKVYIAIAVLILGCFAGYDASVGDYFCLSRIIVFFPFYCLGTALGSERIVELKGKVKPWLIILAAVFVLGWLYVCFFHCNLAYHLRHLFTGRNPFSEGIMAIGPLVRLFCYVVSFGMCSALVILVPNIKLGPITEWGSRTINVFFWHLPIYFLLEHVVGMGRLFYLGAWGKILFLLCGVLLTVILSQFKLFGFPINQIRQLSFWKNEENDKKESSQ